MKKEKIDSLQGLRTLAFLGIFLCHARFFFSWAKLGVSIFFVLSGFLMYRKYCNKEIETSIKNNLKFSLNKIKKLYSLHIVTMLFAIVLNILLMLDKGIIFNDVFLLIIEVLLNITLLQTWVPDSSINTSLNGVAWYLSVSLFLYFLFPYIINKVKNWSSKRLIITSLVILLLEYVVCIPLIKYLGNNSKIYIWFMYCFPVFRIGDFLIGMCFGKLYNNKKDNISILKSTIIELLIFIVSVFVIIFSERSYSNIFIQALQNWTTIFIPIAILFLYIFVNNKGLIVKILSNKLFVFIGDISAYLFLIHFVVIKYVEFIINHYCINVSTNMSYVIIVLELIVSILLSMGYKKLINRK